MTPIDIHDPITELCTRLDLEPNNVAEIIFRPREVIATVYKTRNGSKYLETDTGRAAEETRTFKVTT